MKRWYKLSGFAAMASIVVTGKLIADSFVMKDAYVSYYVLIGTFAVGAIVFTIIYMLHDLLEVADRLRGQQELILKRQEQLLKKMEDREKIEPEPEK